MAEAALVVIRKIPSWWGYRRKEGFKRSMDMAKAQDMTVAQNDRRLHLLEEMDEENPIPEWQSMGFRLLEDERETDG